MYLKTVSKDLLRISMYLLYILNHSINFLQVDPHCKWAILNVKNEDLPVSEAFPHFLADSHHQVRILAARSITR